MMKNPMHIYMRSSRVNLGVQFCCARCMELSSIGRSRLKHLNDSPFNLDMPMMTVLLIHQLTWLLVLLLPLLRT